ncbi:bifunctional 4-hydroxy-2-oxoglutarate aldolase/2-dehydro-3-deoxy-phosphogluconate aldolase [Leifsonia sp. AG29]|uniref:bifunctional 4-hydroxy-2-oxoglutarate aldolase/2-dehydro-3-deoxy-phosphogluconate aldolase n=1 Tax=Leifsonia sp. AG29 TaxID=2598860 RepID=UPI00131AEC84|nr:bifunctional 4-hydroxy-2-oxoglutarate aldolase/2-dehydro-3-deoxy-phosphogluconate aldolase [Leifsonia sp. AG29]
MPKTPESVVSGVVPLAVLESPSEAERLADALVSAGVAQVEVALRSEGAWEAAAAILAHGGVSVGVGTVTTAEQARRAAGLGASFVVSPGFVPEVADAGAELELAYIPGVATPTEAISARAAGYGLLKVYPVEAFGGLALVEALAAVLPGVCFMPSGGVNAAVAPRYLAHRAVVAVSGSWMVPRRLIDDGNWDAIATLCAETRALVRTEAVTG